MRGVQETSANEKGADCAGGVGAAEGCEGTAWERTIVSGWEGGSLDTGGTEQGGAAKM